MSAGHDHGAKTANERNLWIVLGLTAAFMLAEIVGGIVTRSLALISDAARTMALTLLVLPVMYEWIMSRRHGQKAPSKETAV